MIPTNQPKTNQTPTETCKIDIPNNPNNNNNNNNKPPSILTNFHAAYFWIPLSLSSQALLLKTLTSHSSTTLHFPLSTTFHLLWSISVALLSILSLLFLLRCFLRLDAIKAEFGHNISVNYLFTPSISWLLLLQSSPFLHPYDASYVFLFWVFTVPVVALEVKIYGQWFTKGKKFLFAVANPTSQMSVVANMVCARAAAEMEWRETALCVFSLGMAHYVVLFVTLYQRFCERVPANVRPVFFLFFAAPSFASLAWCSISGRFDVGAKMFFFLALFLFASLISRPILFKKSMKRFNIAWWAYSSPLTMLALTSLKYAEEVKGRIPDILMLFLSVVSVIIALMLIVFTVLKSSQVLPYDDPFMATSKTSKIVGQSGVGRKGRSSKDDSSSDRT